MSFRWIPLSRRAEKLARGLATAPERAKPRRRRMLLESLEDRTLLSNSIPVSAIQWTPIGPAPILNGPDPGNQPITGRITGIAASPTDPNTIYVATAGGGVWKTSDDGTNWVPLTDNQPTLFMGSIALAPSNPNVIYAGTGEQDNTIDSFYGQGILKSTDGGASWTLENANGKFTRSEIAAIAVDPSDPNTVYAAVDTGAVNSSIGVVQGIYKSSDGGTTWGNTTAGISGTGGVTPQFSALVINPNNPNVLYAAAGASRGSSLNGVYKSTDGGATWNLQSGVPSGTADGRIALAISQSNPGTVVVSIVGSGQSGSTAYGTLFKFLETKNGGTLWTDLTANTPNYFDNAQGWYDTALAIDPADPLILYAGGSSIGGNNGIIESQDGGQTWAPIISDTSGNGPGVNAITFAFDASGNLLDGTTEGLFQLLNSTSTPNTNYQWVDVNGDLQITQFEGIALNPTNSNLVYGGSQDTGTEEFDDALQWTHIDNGNGGQIAVDPLNTQILYHTTSYTGTDVNFFQVSTNGGATWTAETTGINVGTANPDPSNFYPALALDPSNSNRVMVGTNTLYQTLTANTGTATWTAIGGPTATGWDASGNINSIVISPSAPNTIYVSTTDGRVLFTNNDGASWSDVSIRGVTDSLTGLVINPTNPQNVFVVRNTFDTGNVLGQVFETADGGKNWTDINGNLPTIPTWSMAVDFSQPSALRLFVGTDSGVYTSTNLGQTWQPFESGLPNVQVTSLVLNTSLNILAAGTHGRGVWEIEETNPLQLQVNAPTGLVEGVALTNFEIGTFTDGANPGPASSFSATINWGDGKPASHGTITTGLGGTFDILASHTYALYGTYTITVSLFDSSGDEAVGSTTVTVADAPITPVNGFTVNSTEGQVFNGVVANFIDADANAPLSGFTALITWGNGKVTTGAIQPVAGSPGTFQITGTNTYAVFGTYNVTVVVNDKGGSSAVITGTADVVDAPLSSAGTTLSATEGVPFSLPVASFSDQDPLATLSDYSATINWGDGATSAGTLGETGTGGFIVNGTHTYAAVGSDSVTVVIDDVGGSSTTAHTTVNVADAPLQNVVVGLTGTEGTALAPLSGPPPVVASFNDADSGAVVSDYAPAVIQWGDGTTSPGTIVAEGAGLFDILGNHIYQEFGTYTLTVAIIDDADGRTASDPTDSTLMATDTVTIDDASLVAFGGSASGTEGQAILPTAGSSSTILATFNDFNPIGSTADFTASIDWGDGTVTTPDVGPGLITQPGGVGTTFDVSGTHVYTEAGNYTATVTINDAGGASATATSTVSVADAPLSGSFVALPALTEGGVFTDPVATFTDANTSAIASDFLVPITWGDGNTSLGTVDALGSGAFSVSGSDTYAQAGSYPVTVTVIDLGGSRLTLNGTAHVQDAPIVAVLNNGIFATEGTQFSGQIGAFTQSATTPASSFTASVNWGDGTTTTGQVASLGNGQFTVSGNNTFPAAGNFTIHITVSDLLGTTGTLSTAAVVADAPISGTGLNLSALLGDTYSGPVAQFVDGDISAPASDFTATITWGDGHVTPGQISASGAGQFQVLGTNTYEVAGLLNLSVAIHDVGGNNTTASGTVDIIHPVSGTVTTSSATNVNTPTFSGMAQPGTLIQLLVTSIGTPSTSLILGPATADSTGHWSITSSALSDGDYTVTAQMYDAMSGNLLQTIQLLPSGTSGPLIIDTAPPTVAGVTFNPLSGQLVITYQDTGSGVNPRTLVNGAAYRLTLTGSRAKSFTPSTISVAPGGLPGQLTATLHFAFGRKVSSGKYVFSINGAAITDLAGNTLHETTFVTFPQTSNSPNPNWIAQFKVSKSGTSTGPQPYISPAELRAAARYARSAQSRARVRFHR